MDTEGSLHIVWLNKGEMREPQFVVKFWRYQAAASEAKSRTFLGEEALWEFLAYSLRVGGDHIGAAFADLRQKGSAEINSHNILADDLRRFQLDD